MVYNSFLIIQAILQQKHVFWFGLVMAEMKVKMNEHKLQ